MKSADNIKISDCTYRELGNALLHLNFSNKSTKSYFVYINNENDIEFVLPKREEDAIVEKADIIGITFHLTWKGLTENRDGLEKIILAERLRSQKKSA